MKFFLGYFSFFQDIFQLKRFKPHLTVTDELLRLKKCSSRERIIGYEKLLRIIINAKTGSIITAVRKHKIIPIKPQQIQHIARLHERRNMLVHTLNNIPEKTLRREADAYEVIVKKYLKHYEKGL